MAIVPREAPSGRRQRARLYDRVSSKAQSESGYSGGEAGYQLDRCEAYCATRGYDIVGRSSDVESGAAWETDGYMAALESAKAGEYDVLVVAETSRFARNVAKKVIQEADLARHAVRVEYTNLPGLPTDDSPDAKFMRNSIGGLYGAMDEYDRDKRAWHTKQGKRKKAEVGNVVGSGPHPYGYEYAKVWDARKKKDVPIGFAIDATTAPIVERIFREIRVLSAGDIARALTAEGVPTPSGLGYAIVQTRRGPKRTRSKAIDTWGPSTVYKIVQNAAYRGVWTFDGIEVAVPRLVSDADWRAAQEMLTVRRRARRGRKPADDDPYTLRGRLTCGHCGGVLAAQTRPAGRGMPRARIYTCLRHYPNRARTYGWEVCPLPSMDATGGGIEDLAWQMIDGVLFDPEKLTALLDSIDDQYGEQRADRERRMAMLDAEITKHEHQAKRAAAEMLKVDEDDPRYAIFADAAAKAAETIRTFRAERDRYAAMAPIGVTSSDRATLQAFADRYQASIEDAGPAERRRVIEMLRLTARISVVDGEDGVGLGGRARFRVEWSPTLHSEHGMLMLYVLCGTGGPRLLGIVRNPSC